MWMGPPKASDMPKPMSSISTIRTLGAPAGALTSNRGGGVALRAFNTVLLGTLGSGIGSIVRSVGPTTFTGAGVCAETGTTVDGAASSATASSCVTRTLTLFIFLSPGDVLSAVVVSGWCDYQMLIFLTERSLQ